MKIKDPEVAHHTEGKFFIHDPKAPQAEHITNIYMEANLLWFISGSQFGEGIVKWSKRSITVDMSKCPALRATANKEQYFYLTL